MFLVLHSQFSEQALIELVACDWDIMLHLRVSHLTVSLARALILRSPGPHLDQRIVSLARTDLVTAFLIS